MITTDFVNIVWSILVKKTATKFEIAHIFFSFLTGIMCFQNLSMVAIAAT